MSDEIKPQPCPFCGSLACARGGGQMSGYWVIHAGCDESRKARGLPPIDLSLPGDPPAITQDRSEQR